LADALGTLDLEAILAGEVEAVQAEAFSLQRSVNALAIRETTGPELGECRLRVSQHWQGKYCGEE
jgi:hypothetical protein